MFDFRLPQRVNVLEEKYRQNLANRYLEKAERERELVEIDKDIWKHVGAIQALEEVHKYLEELLVAHQKETAEKAAKTKLEQANA